MKKKELFKFLFAHQSGDRKWNKALKDEDIQIVSSRKNKQKLWEYWIYTTQEIIRKYELSPEKIKPFSSADKKKRRLYSNLKKEQLGVTSNKQMKKALGLENSQKYYKEVNPKILSYKTKEIVYVAYFDASFISPKEAYVGYVLLSNNNKIVKEKGVILTSCKNSFEAELNALKVLVIDLYGVKGMAQNYIIYGDAKPVIDAMGALDPKSKYIEDLREVTYYLKNIKSSYTLQWIPRYQNFYADYICQLAKSRKDTMLGGGGDYSLKKLELIEKLHKENNKALRGK